LPAKGRQSVQRRTRQNKEPKKGGKKKEKDKNVHLERRGNKTERGTTIFSCGAQIQSVGETGGGAVVVGRRLKHEMKKNATWREGQKNCKRRKRGQIFSREGGD